MIRQRRNAMRRIAIMAASVLAFAAASVEVAAAADGCGRGRYWNGYRCAGGGGGYYGGPRVYGGGYYGGGYARPPRVQGSVRCDYRGRCYPAGPLSCGNPGYTVQDGVCKPYRGY
jgi:hypothetical protein